MTNYEKYQLQWLIDHNHSITELIQELEDYINQFTITKHYTHQLDVLLKKF